MNALKWDDELTELAIKNQTHQSWAVSNPADMLKALRMIADRSGGYPKTSRDELKAAVGTPNFDFLDRLLGFGFIYERPDSQGITVYAPSREPRSPAFHTGEFLMDLVRNYGINTPDGLAAIGHNFILGARESLEFCAALQRPGLTKDALKKRFLNRLVFNNKLNPFKFDNLFQFLSELGLIEESEKLYRIAHSPAPLTFYCMVERYLLEANYIVETRVNATDQVCYLDRLLPVEPSRREMRFEFLGLSRFPFEGWGKYDTWLTVAGFRDLLRVGLIHPLSVAKVLSKLLSDSYSVSQSAARRGFAKIRDRFVSDTDTHLVWDLPIEGLDEWRRVFAFCKTADQMSLL
jgi:hypothetical protein